MILSVLYPAKTFVVKMHNYNLLCYVKYSISLPLLLPYTYMLCVTLCCWTLCPQCLELACPVLMTSLKREQKIYLQMNTMTTTGLIWTVRPFLVAWAACVKGMSPMQCAQPSMGQVLLCTASTSRSCIIIRRWVVCTLLLEGYYCYGCYAWYEVPFQTM